MEEYTNRFDYEDQIVHDFIKAKAKYIDPTDPKKPSWDYKREEFDKYFEEMMSKFLKK